MLECKTKRIWKVKIWMRDQAVSAHVMQSWVKRQKHIESSHFSPYTSRFLSDLCLAFLSICFCPQPTSPPPLSRHYLFEICMERICFCHAYLTFIPFCGPAGSIPCKDCWLKSSKHFISFSREETGCAKYWGNYSFWSRTYVPGCLQARFWFLAGKWGSVNHREIVSNWLAKPLYENWTYTSSRGYCQIFLL